MTEQEKYMAQALALAREAAEEGEVPVGCVIVKDGKIIGEGWHEHIGGLHAERNAFAHCTEDAAGADLYVTLEPCPMCMGAILNARLDSVYFGAFDAKAGACGSVVDLNAYPFNHTCAVSGGHMENESAKLLGDFFKRLRKRVKQTITEGISE